MITRVRGIDMDVYFICESIERLMEGGFFRIITQQLYQNRYDQSGSSYMAHHVMARISNVIDGN